MIPNVDMYGIASLLNSGMGIVFLLLVLGGCVALVAKFIMDKKAYNKKAIIIRHYGNVRVPISDIFKFVFEQKKNIKYFYGKKSKAKIPAETWEAIERDESNKDFLLINNPAPDEYISMKISEVGVEPIISTNKKAWYVYAHRDNVQRFEFLDFLAKYANIIALAGIVILMLINFIFQGAVMDKNNANMGMMNANAESLRAASENMILANEVLYRAVDKAINLTAILQSMEGPNGTDTVVYR